VVEVVKIGKRGGKEEEKRGKRWEMCGNIEIKK
jgi:hypothetical protein